MSIHLSKNPNCLENFKSAYQLTVSYALCISNFRIILEPLTFLVRECSNYWAKRMLSWISLSLIKPLCLGEINWGSTSANLVDRKLEMILLEKLHKLIVLSCLNSVGLDTLGTITIKLLVQDLGSSNLQRIHTQHHIDHSWLYPSRKSRNTR